MCIGGVTQRSLQIKILRLFDRLNYLYKIGFKVMMKRLAKNAISPIYRHETGYITVRGQDSFPVNEYLDTRGTDCIIFETAEAIREWENRVSLSIPYQSLYGHLCNTPHSMVIFAIRPTKDGSSRKVVGFRYCQKGVIIFLDFKKSLPMDILFVNHTEVLPKYRGQRVNRLMMNKTNEYCLQNGLTKIIGVISAHNIPSVKQNIRWKGAGVIGIIELKSWLGGIYKSTTSWDDIEKAIIGA